MRPSSDAMSICSGEVCTAGIRSTSVVSPPGGDLVEYLASLNKVFHRSEKTYWPTHGPPVRDPRPFVEAYLKGVTPDCLNEVDLREWLVWAKLSELKEAWQKPLRW